jgi:hypothetical protein
MRELAKNNKTNLILFGASLLLFIIILATNARAEEPQMENMLPPGQVFHELHTANDTINELLYDFWTDRMIPQAAFELRINQVLYRNAIIRPLLQKEQFQHIEPQYETAIFWLEYILARRHSVGISIAESDATKLIESTISLQEFLLLANQQTNQTTTSEGYNHWSLALTGMKIGLLIALVIAVAWGK